MIIGSRIGSATTRPPRASSRRNWDRPDLPTWIDRLTAAVERTPGAVLVGHSLGCVLIAHLARRRPQLPIGGALLVAPADVDLSERLRHA